MPQRYDVVVIGTGLGGLTAAALLARAGRKVLVIERNTSVGGAASTYKSGDLLIEGALHETADARNPADPKHHVLKRIGILDAIEWVPTGALYEVRGGPVGAPFLLPDGFAKAGAALTARFPATRAGIATVLGEIERVAASDVSRSGEGRSLAAVLDSAFGDDEGAKCALAANLAYYHDDPVSLAWPFFAAAQGSYIATGGAFIRGGSQRLSNALRRAIQAAGGEVMLKRKASELRLGGDDRPESVVHTDRAGGDPIVVEAAVVVSNAAPAVLAAMLDEPARQRLHAAFAGRPLSVSLFSATFGLSQAATEFGLTSYSTILLPAWMRRLADYPRGVDLLRAADPDNAPVLTIANYSAIDAGLGGPPFPVSVFGLDRIENWAGFAGEDYERQRTRVLDAIKIAIDRAFPGFAAHVVAAALNTASSMSSYLNATQGAIYGFAPLSGAPDRSPETPIPGLYLASAYSGGGGFTGAIGGGAAAADRILSEA